jgi:hypothetical protein
LLRLGIPKRESAALWKTALQFGWVLGMLAEEDQLKGKTLGVDATTREANAAMRSIVRRDSGESYEQFLTGQAEASGSKTPSREDLAKGGKTRRNKASNDDWQNPQPRFDDVSQRISSRRIRSICSRMAWSVAGSRSSR